MNRLGQILTFLFLLSGSFAEVTIDAMSPVVTPNFTEMAHSLGMPCEEVEVTTKDGYILTMFHIQGNPKKPAVMQSGNLGTSDDLILLGNISLTFVLWKAGFDTWVGNVRGCRYGRRHVCLDPDTSDEFWDFSFHEYAIYDTTAMVDAVLNRTGAPSVSSIGWSYGTATNFIMGAERPEYNEKVNVIIALAPIAYLHHSISFSLTAPLFSLLNITLSMLDSNEVYGEKSIETTLLRKTCSTVEMAYGPCLEAVYPTFGFDREQMEPELAPKFFQHYPSSSSRKNVAHEAQTVESKRFAQFDYGPEENMKRYGSKLPKLYDMSKNTIPIVLIWGKNDQASKLGDVDLLKPQIVNLDEHIILEPEKFSHLDFVAGKDTHKVLYETIVLEKLKKYNNP